jgi:hypothetical protein
MYAKLLNLSYSQFRINLVDPNTWVSHYKDKKKIKGTENQKAMSIKLAQELFALPTLEEVRKKGRCTLEMYKDLADATLIAGYTNE